MTTPTRTGVTPGQGLLAIVGLLVAVEVASGVLQGYYTPIFSDIADHLGIDDGDFDEVEALLAEALEEHGVSAEDIRVIGAVIETKRSLIVARRAA